MKMLKISFSVLMLIAVVIASDECGQPFNLVCNNESVPKKLPETAEELKDVCTFVIGFLECAVDYEEQCDGPREIREEINSYLVVAKDVCREDTLLYAAIVENLKCLSSMRDTKSFDMECKMQSGDSSSVAKYVEALSEEGLLAVTDDEYENYSTELCAQTLLEMACVATEIEDTCGTVAMDTFVEVIGKFDMTDYAGSECAEILRLLPTMIQLYKVEQVETNEIVDALKKRK